MKPSAANAAAIATAAQQTASATPGLEVTFYPSYSVYDGRFANNGWLQECPDAMTKQVWGNSALNQPGHGETPEHRDR